MAVKKKKQKNTLIPLSKQPILKPIDINKIGTNGDPCFGKHYNLSTPECKICGDSELCCITFAQLVGKSRKELEEDNKYKDLDTLMDKAAIKKYYRGLKRKDLGKKEILDKMQTKYELTREEARHLYKEFSTI